MEGVHPLREYTREFLPSQVQGQELFPVEAAIGLRSERQISLK